MTTADATTRTRPATRVAVSFDDVLAARDRLAGVVNRTPVVTSRTLNERTGRAVFLKCENLQRGGAFKFRGAYNRISRRSPEERRCGVVAYSSGNHAQGVALAARLLGVPATIVMPADAPSVKLEATRGYGAEVVAYDRYTEDRAQVGVRLAQDRGLTLVRPYDDPRIIAGQGTAALELFEDVPDLDVLVVPVSGGGLISGCAIAAHGMRPQTRVVGVEPDTGDDTRQSLERGERVSIDLPPTIADGLRVQTPGEITFPIVREHVEEIVLVSDDEILDAMRFAFLRLKLVVEPSGAVPLAALLAGRIGGSGDRIGLVISGGNVDPRLMARLWPAS